MQEYIIVVVAMAIGVEGQGAPGSSFDLLSASIKR